MANDYFRFKQFLINQDKCAMKVCTDSCILGAYAVVENAGKILDIGTGTGLLALMAAQRSQAIIQAVEIEEKAAEQARENVQNSPWPDRITVFNQSLQEFGPNTEDQYDVILCNPPFYLTSQKSPDAARNKAMHHEELSFANIIDFCKLHLAPTGILYILLPPAESEIFNQQAQNNSFFLVNRLKIYTSVFGKHIRNIQQYSRTSATKFSTAQLAIRQPDNLYTEDFIQLLNPYYLHL